MCALLPRRRSRIEVEAIAEAARLHVPFTLQLSLTDRCNLGCIHCYRVEERRPELTTAEVCDLLADAAAAGTFVLVLTGGEVFCRGDLPAILARALELRFATRVYTNGTLIDEQAADMLAATGVHQVHVSVYSDEPDVHDAITGVPGSLAASLAAIERLRRGGVRVMLKCVIMRPNLESFPSVLALAERLGASCAFDPVVTVRNDGDRSPLACRLDFDELVSVLAHPVITAAGSEEVVTGEFAYSGELADAPACAAGFNLVAVSPGGDVTPCVALPLLAGNVRQQSLSNIWQDAPAFARVRSIRLRDIETCATCADLAACGRCPGSAMLEDGNLEGPSRAACTVAAARRAAAGKGDKP
jgi:radical SAM protein with 4Fe4S-binding SPASM domain